MAKDFSGGPKPLKPTTGEMPSNTNFSGKAVPVVQSDPFGSSQTGDACSPKFSPLPGGGKKAKK